MRKLALVLEYEGTRYSGFQVQPDRPTIAGELGRALERLTGEHVKIQGAGRTDAGVHAKGQVAAFVTRASYKAEAFKGGLNAHLPEDIRVRGAWEVAPDFDPRRHATSRKYRYLMTRGCSPSALWRNLAHHVAGPLEVTAVREAARLLVGTHDFAAFCGAGSWVRGTVRHVLEAEVVEKGRLLAVTMEANAFLPQQVRRTVGALVQVGQGRMTAAQFKGLVEEPVRGAARQVFPAKGLCLVSVKYGSRSIFPEWDGDDHDEEDIFG
ncbi:MAG: tRNA pseudouridine(38-40) synthase TruA [Chloroflexi bacterium]|nr:tRNA pseudouridine(38-40) synthase TruA [Chloroflexota bacterium]